MLAQLDAKPDSGSRERRARNRKGDRPQTKKVLPLDHKTNMGPARRRLDLDSILAFEADAGGRALLGRPLLERSQVACEPHAHVQSSERGGNQRGKFCAHQNRVGSRELASKMEARHQDERPPAETRIRNRFKFAPPQPKRPTAATSRTTGDDNSIQRPLAALNDSGKCTEALRRDQFQLCSSKRATSTGTSHVVRCKLPETRSTDSGAGWPRRQTGRVTGNGAACCRANSIWQVTICTLRFECCPRRAS